MWRKLGMTAALLGSVAYSSRAQTYSQVGSDIPGETVGEAFGSGVSMSSDGKVIAVMSPMTGMPHWQDPVIRAFEWTRGYWRQRGQDILSGTQEDNEGVDISLSADGSTMAIGSYELEPFPQWTVTDTGHVDIYRWEGESWVELGDRLHGESARDRFGYSVSLSSDGTVVAVGSNDLTKILDWSGTNWVQRGPSLEGFLLTSSSLSSNGDVIAVVVTDAGGTPRLVRVYDWTETGWVKRGDILMEAEWVSLSSNGNVLAIGTSTCCDEHRWVNHVRIYDWDGTEWMQRGGEIEGKNAIGAFGDIISLSGDGNTIAQGDPLATLSYGPFSHIVLENAGKVRVSTWDGTDWIQRGSEIEGMGERELSGFSVALSEDGRILTTGAPSEPSYDYPHLPTSEGLVRVYDLGAINVNSEQATDRTTPSELQLVDVYPNPFREIARIRIRLERSTDVRITVFDLLGREVVNLSHGILVPGVHEFAWDATDGIGSALPNGIYVLGFDVAGQTRSKMVTLHR